MPLVFLHDLANEKPHEFVFAVAQLFQLRGIVVHDLFDDTGERIVIIQLPESHCLDEWSSICPAWDHNASKSALAVLEDNV